MPQGDLKVTLNLPVVLLIEVMVNLSEAVSAVPCGSRRMMMSDQSEVTAVIPARLLPPSRLKMTLAVPPLFFNSNALEFKLSAQAVLSPVRLSTRGAGVAFVSAFAFEEIGGGVASGVAVGSGDAAGCVVATGDSGEGADIGGRGEGVADGEASGAGDGVTTGRSRALCGDGSGIAVTVGAGVSAGTGDAVGLLLLLSAFAASNVATRAAGAGPVCASSPASEPLTLR